ncbi:MAG: AGE family epimerase/isomerase, partial [Alphaproteobacteria bacterium]
VLLAAAAAHKAGVRGAKRLMDDVTGLLEDRFYDPAAELYVDVIHPGNWDAIDSYRGQNANMHMCEAMIAAHAATGERRFLDRAEGLAHRVCVDLADRADGSVWEHYHTNWTPDWNYNRDDPRNLFRPHGFLPGHLVEWAKLLISLDRQRPQPWLMPKAIAFFSQAVEAAWDTEHGGLHYAFGRDGAILDTDRYYWVIAEAIAAAALLGARTGEADYWLWYDRFWDYADRYLIDHTHGGWYRLVDIGGRRYDDLKSPAVKTDYHPLSACYMAMASLNAV